MHVFSIPLADRKLVLPYERDFQAHVALEANRVMGLKKETLIALSHQKGGVVVAGSRVVIDENFVFDLDNHNRDANAAEKATAQALQTCVQVFKDLTTQGVSPAKIFMDAPLTILMGTRLHQFFRNIP